MIIILIAKSLSAIYLIYKLNVSFNFCYIEIFAKRKKLIIIKNTWYMIMMMLNLTFDFR